MRPILVAAAAATIVASSAHAIVVRHDRDASDYLADEADYPFLGWLYLSQAGTRDCIVTLVDPEWVITAKHCTEGERFRAEVASGTRELSFAGGAKAVMDRLVEIPQRDVPFAANDVVLLHLAQPITSIVPVPLYDHRDEVGRIIILPGWGGTGDGIRGVSGDDGIFRVAENRIDHAGDGIVVWRFDDPRSFSGKALAYEGISGPGDSGGPALLMTSDGWKVAGVSSMQRTFGGSEGRYNVEEVFARASEIRGWATEVIATQE